MTLKIVDADGSPHNPKIILKYTNQQFERLITTVINKRGLYIYHTQAKLRIIMLYEK
jgi:hypothetical protein